MRKLIWGLVFLFLQNWVLRKLGPAQGDQDPRSGVSFIEFIEKTFKRMVVFVVTMIAASISSLIGVYFILQSVRLWLEQDMGWQPLATTALFAFVFIGVTAALLLGHFKAPAGSIKIPAPVANDPRLALDR